MCGIIHKNTSMNLLCPQQRAISHCNIHGLLLHCTAIIRGSTHRGTSRPGLWCARTSTGALPLPGLSCVTITCYRGARPSSYIFGYIKTRKFTYNNFKITCKNCVSFSPESALLTVE